VGQVRVRLDAARHHDPPRRVDDASGLAERLADGDDALALDPHVPAADTARRDDVSPADDEIEHAVSYAT
jgi:hypothetical protein